MIKILFLSFIPLFIWADLSLAESRCPASTQPVEVTFDVRQGRVIERHDLSRLQMSSFAARRGARNVPEGFTDTRYEYRLSVSAQPIVRQGRTCIYLRSVSLGVTIHDIKVFIARKHRPGSCPFNVVRDHEDQHVEIFQSAMDEYLPLIESKLENVAWKMKPVQTQSSNNAADVFLRKINQAIQPVFDRMDRQVVSEHAEIDTPESYRALTAQCDDW